jgi:hypothetical protein
LQAKPCRHGRHPCGLGNMKAPWMGTDEGPRPVRPDIPDLVEANTMPILYTSRPEESRKRRNLEPGTTNKGGKGEKGSGTNGTAVGGRRSWGYNAPMGQADFQRISPLP